MTHHSRLLRSYVLGFILSLLLTIAAFTLTSMQADSGGRLYPELPLVISLAVLAITQLIVQLFLFFHLDKEAKPRLNSAAFLFMLMVVSIIAFGSLWIMYNLNYHMMPGDVETYIQNEENIQPSKPNHSDHSGH